MRLQKIIIKNFKGISNSITMSLAPNKNGIEMDLKTGFFKEIGGNISPNAVGIIGRNGIGKTTILDAVEHINKAFKEDHFIEGFTRVFLMDKAMKEAEKQTKDIFEVFKILSNQKTFSEKIPKKIIVEEHPNYLKNMFNRLSHKRSESINIELHFLNNNDNIKLKMAHTANNLSLNMKLNGIKIEDPIEYYKKEFLGIITFFRVQQENRLLEDINFLLNHFGEEMTNLYLGIADPNIKEIITNKKKTKLSISKIVLHDGDSIKPSYLSTGTQRFISIITFIEKQIKNKKNNIVLIDEIDLHLHAKLASFIIKRVSMVNKYKNFQIFFTTHTPELLESLSYKQSFIIDNDLDEIQVTKISSLDKMRNNSSFSKRYINERVSSHPSKDKIENFLVKASS